MDAGGDLMRGATELLNARLQGYRPAMVFVDLDIGPVAEEFRGEDQVQIEDTDRLSGLDLRCVYGLTVNVSGENAGKTRGVAQACLDAGASRVITNISDGRKVIEVADTEGVLTWIA